MLKVRLFLGLFFILILSLNAQADKVIISGKVIDRQGEGVNNARLEFYVDGKPYRLKKILKTSPQGNFVINLSAEDVVKSKIKIEITKSGYKSVIKELKGVNLAFKGDTYYGYVEIVFNRSFGPTFYLTTIIMLIVFIFIAFEALHRTLAALIGASLILFITYTIGTFNADYFIISFEEAIAAIDFNVIFLLMGMMIIVSIMKITGVFQWLSYKAYQLSKGNIGYLVIILIIGASIISAFLDNVTTMILLVPIAIEIASFLGTTPIILLIPVVFASNIGGTLTLIGHPPNIMIGSYANLTFNDFISYMTLPLAIVLVALILMTNFYYGKKYKEVKIEDVEGLLKRLKEEYKITQPQLLKYSLFILGFVILLFVLHGIFHMEASIPAMVGAAILLLLSQVSIIRIIEEVEWTTLVFFMMLFIIVGAAEEIGLIQIIGEMIKTLSAGNLTMAILLILWTAAIMSGIIDNIPFTATMLPVVGYLTKTIPGAENNILWWALSLGAGLGANGTSIGATANIMTVGMLEKAGYPIRFFDFLKIGLPVTIITVIIASLWLLLTLSV